MSKYKYGNNPEKINKYKAFWDLDDVDRPIIGFTFRGFFPMEEYEITKKWKPGTILTPDMIIPEEFINDEFKLLSEGKKIDDDIIRGDSPAAAVIPWLSGMMGSELKILPGNILGKEMNLSWDAVKDISFNKDNDWYKKYIGFAEVLVDKAKGCFPVSHGAFRGPSDLLGLLRGSTQSIIDLKENPNRTMDLLWKLSDIFIEVTESIWDKLPLYHGGYFDGMYQLWAPGPIARLQEDASVLYSPELYRELLQPIDKKIASHFENTFMHLHSTSMFLLEEFLEIDDIKCFEINNDEGGPSIKDMIPYFKMVQEARRPLLIRGSFTSEDISLLINSLKPSGLYLLIMVESMEEVYKIKSLIDMN